LCILFFLARFDRFAIVILCEIHSGYSEIVIYKVTAERRTDSYT